MAATAVVRNHVIRNHRSVSLLCASRSRADLANRLLATQGVSRFLLSAWPLLPSPSSLHEKSFATPRSRVALVSQYFLSFFLFFFGYFSFSRVQAHFFVKSIGYFFPSSSSFLIPILLLQTRLQHGINNNRFRRSNAP